MLFHCYSRRRTSYNAIGTSALGHLRDLVALHKPIGILARIAGCAQPSICHYLRRHGIATGCRRRRRQDLGLTVPTVLKLIVGGLTIGEIAKQCGVSRKSLAHFVRENGLKPTGISAATRRTLLMNASPHQ